VQISRRKLFAQTMCAGLETFPTHDSTGKVNAIKAIAFDGFAIFDPQSVSSRAEETFPGRAAELMNLWRTRQFEYSWLRTSMQRYEDFWHVTDDALRFAANALKLDLNSRSHARLMDAYLELKTWPDVVPALSRLKTAGLRLSLLSNFTNEMMRAGIRNSSLDDMFEHILSTDGVRAYKPAPRAYSMGVDAFRLKRQQILFVAFAGWDAAGAASFGYPTFWTNRLNATAEMLGAGPISAGLDLDEMVRWLLPKLPGSS